MTILTDQRLRLTLFLYLSNFKYIPTMVTLRDKNQQQISLGLFIHFTIHFVSNNIQCVPRFQPLNTLGQLFLSVNS